MGTAMVTPKGTPPPSAMASSHISSVVHRQVHHGEEDESGENDKMLPENSGGPGRKTGSHRDWDLAAEGDMDDDSTVTRLRLAKVLSFASGAGMVAWKLTCKMFWRNKFASLWLLSVGFSPAEIGVMKSVGLVAKSISQPLWALLADLQVPARIHPALSPVSLHFVAIFSSLLSLAFMELLRENAGRMAFTAFLILRTLWCFVNSGSQLTDALVAHMSHKTKEGFGRQRLWGSVAWGSMSFFAGAMVDTYGLNALFVYTFIARTVLMGCIVFAMLKIVEGRGAGMGAGIDVGDKTTEQMRLKRILPLLREQPQLCVLLAVTMLHGFIMVICENILSYQMDRDFKMSRALNGLSSTVGLCASVPTYYHSKAILEKFGHFLMIASAQGLTVVMLLLHSFVTQEYALLVLPISAIKGAVVALFWTAAVDMMQDLMDPNLQSSGQTALSWMYFTIGGGMGHTFWSAYYQNRGASETYLLGSIIALANMGLLRMFLCWSGVNFWKNFNGHRSGSAVEMV